MKSQTSFAAAAATLILAGWGIAPAAQAQLIDAASATGTGTFNNSTDLIIDDVIPAEGSTWNQPDKVWWNGLTPTFTVDLGDIFTVQDMLISVDGYGFDRVASFT